MGIFFGWLLLSFLVGAFGSNRRIGFWGTFFLSLILSPIVGLIGALLSKPKPSEAEQAFVKMQAAGLGMAETSTVDHLERLAKLKADGVLSAEEFEVEKKRVLGGTVPSTHAETQPPPKPQGSGDVYDIPMR